MNYIRDRKFKKKAFIKVQSNIDFNNIKSLYIFKKIFNHLYEKKLLDLIKYNKKIQKRLNITINDYKNYFELIEIEIIPVKNEFCEFINISNEKDEKYYHIYFDDDKTEIKRNYLIKGDRVSTIKIMVDNQITSFNELFKGCNCIESIYFKKINRNNIKNITQMFSMCSL